ncbi:hypothetical protein BSKO_07045 [Bryopsis sp. KO-2023]|nr:hypothetical protein BSKO_07045 [Bryopsis sp. KO-2023]
MQQRGRVSITNGYGFPGWRSRIPNGRVRGMRPHTRLEAKVDRTAYRAEMNHLLKSLITRQAVKTCLKYLEETNGQLHYFLHCYVAANPLPISADVSSEDWLTKLAASPWTTITHPGRTSNVSPAALAAAVEGEREVSPRDVAERIMKLRLHLAKEMAEDLDGLPMDNDLVLRRALEMTIATNE